MNVWIDMKLADNCNLNDTGISKLTFCYFNCPRLQLLKEQVTVIFSQETYSEIQVKYV